LKCKQIKWFFKKLKNNWETYPTLIS
jgi:hypothetical protein